MKELRNFNIDIYRLSNSTHEYTFDIDNSFFEFFETGLIQKGKAVAKVTLKKTETLIEAILEIEGVVELECDRSLDLFDYPLSYNDRVLYKYGEEEMELNDEIMVITKLTQKINVAQHIYDFINLAIPMKKISPLHMTEEDDESEVRLVYTSVDEDEFDEEDIEDGDDEEADPRWDVLKNLKNNLNDN
ncbi:MAG: DUF177 domain-containing protein [Bacteroidota bacterium]|nr:DUF177 domain-containing protein [Bacteroidota bacterium]